MTVLQVVLDWLGQTVNFVEQEDERLRGVAADQFGQLVLILDTGVKLFKGVVELVGNHVGESRLPGSRWSPQDQRDRYVLIDDLAERFAGGQQVLLANHLGQILWPHPVRQRLFEVATGLVTSIG